MTENTNGHTAFNSADGNRNMSVLDALPLTEKGPSEAPSSLNGSLSRKEEQKMAKAPLRADSEAHEIGVNRRKSGGRRRCCLSCGVAVVVIVAVIVALALTVFKTKDPVIGVVSMSVEGVKMNLDPATLKLHLNLTLIAEVAIKNRIKYASLKHGNSSTAVIYRELTVGEAVIPAGKIKADKTVFKNVSVTVYIDQFVDSASNLVSDGLAGRLDLTTVTNMAGRVKILGMIKKHIHVRAECGVSVNVSSLTADIGNCSKKIKF